MGTKKVASRAGFRQIPSLAQQVPRENHAGLCRQILSGGWFFMPSSELRHKATRAARDIHWCLRLKRYCRSGWSKIITSTPLQHTVGRNVTGERYHPKAVQVWRHLYRMGCRENTTDIFMAAHRRVGSNRTPSYPPAEELKASPSSGLKHPRFDRRFEGLTAGWAMVD